MDGLSKQSGSVKKSPQANAHKAMFWKKQSTLCSRKGGRYNRYLLLSCFALLPSCADNASIWVKAGSTPSEFEQMKAECMLEGHDRVMPDKHRELVSGSSSWASGRCKGWSCSAWGGHTPAQYEQVDKNAPLRNQVIKACFYRNGWTEFKEKGG